MPFIVDDNQFPPEQYEYYLRLFHQNVAAHKREAEQAAKQATSSLEGVDDKQSSSTKTKSTSDATGPPVDTPDTEAAFSSESAVQEAADNALATEISYK